ncbi:MAG: hypothetical protein JXR03_07200 [Cyclobacteriaceae bacterium]
MDNKKCLECGREFFGRADKKFCSNSCKNAFNNQLNSENEAVIKRVNRVLRKNRLILNELNPEEKQRVPQSKLIKKGFDFDYITSTYKTKEGKEYRFCYDQGYLQLENDYFLLVRRTIQD